MIVHILCCLKNYVSSLMTLNRQPTVACDHPWESRKPMIYALFTLFAEADVEAVWCLVFQGVATADPACTFTHFKAETVRHC